MRFEFAVRTSRRKTGGFRSHPGSLPVVFLQGLGTAAPILPFSRTSRAAGQTR